MQNSYPKQIILTIFFSYLSKETKHLRALSFSIHSVCARTTQRTGEGESQNVKTNLMGIYVHIEPPRQGNGYNGNNESIRSPHHHRKPSPEPRLQECVYTSNKEESVYHLSLLHL